MILSLIPSPKCTFFRLKRSTWPTEPALSACRCVVHDNWWHVLKLGESWGNASNQNQRFLDRYRLPTGCVECKVQGYRFDPEVSLPTFHCGSISQSIICICPKLVSKNTPRLQNPKYHSNPLKIPWWESRFPSKPPKCCQPCCTLKGPKVERLGESLEAWCWDCASTLGKNHPIFPIFHRKAVGLSFLGNM